MELHTALRLLDLSVNPTKAQVQSAYRRLVMRYHPDRNPRRSEWTHTMTTRIHEAYVVASKHITSGEPAGVVTRTETPASYADAEQEAARRRIQIHRFAKALDRREHRLHDALHYYYAHRLDRGHLRGAGSQHLRYRRVMRALGAASHECASIDAEAPNSSLAARKRSLEVFAGAMRRCASRPTPIMPQAGGRNYEAFRHLTTGIEQLDGAVCAALFPELKLGGAPWSASSRLSLAFHELMLVVTSYRLSPWLEEAGIRLELLDAFTTYGEHRR